MLKTILVPLDGSSRAEAALPVAAQIARTSGGVIVLVQIVSLATEYWPAITTPYPSMAQAAVDAELEEASRYLKQIAASAELAGITTKTTTQFGAAAPALLSVALSYNADLIVLCSHGYTGMTHWIMGSVAEKIARHASAPVLILHEGAMLPYNNSSDAEQPVSVLIPLDGSEHAMTALEPAIALLTAFARPAQKIALHLMRVIQSPVDKQGDERQRELHTLAQERAKRSLNQAARYVREEISQLPPRHSITVDWSLVDDTDIAKAIAHVAEDGKDEGESEAFGGSDFIAISTHGRGGLQRWTMGSITERVLHTTKLPLLIVRPTDMKYQRNSFTEAREKGAQEILHPHLV